ncbi:MAG: hypothetical protein ACXWPM_00510, partial [Bdellovibrionota bacterium]
VDSAIHSFEDAARGALGRGNDALAGQALYNLGVAEAKKGDFKAALKSYVSAVEAAQKAKDQRLEEDARKNIELLAQQKKDKQQQQKDDQKNQDKQDKEGKDQKDQQQKDQKDQKDQQQKSEKEKENEKKGDQQKDQTENKKQEQKGEKEQKEEFKNGKRQFKSPKISPEDAERVMEELNNKDRQVREKLTNKPHASQRNAKDW